MTVSSPPASVALASRLLAEHGFQEVARNTRGDSLYLQPVGCVFVLRLSNHARSPKQRQRRKDVLASLVIRRPTGARQVAVLVAGAIRDFTAARDRRADALVPE